MSASVASRLAKQNILSKAAEVSARSPIAQTRARPIAAIRLASPEARAAVLRAFPRKGKRKASKLRQQDEQQSVSANAASLEEPIAEQNVRSVDDVVDELVGIHGISSRQLRLSRAARFGALSDSHTGVGLPDAWNKAAASLINKSDRQTIKQDIAVHKDGNSISTAALPVRNAALHLTISSPRRFAAVQTVMRQVRNRLGPDIEDIVEIGGWLPKRIVEYGCGAGEGVWAAATVFGADRNGGRHLRYQGFDHRTALLGTAKNILELNRRANNMSSEERPDDERVHNIVSNMRVEFAMHSRDESNTHSNPAHNSDEAGNTLVVCNHALSKLHDDAAREKFINSIWQRHPNAEVLAFVEAGDQYGFACIASAREQLLGFHDRSSADGNAEVLRIGKHVFHEDKPAESDASEQPAPAKESHVQCHVVAPCPHDKPCPLLHDFQQVTRSDKDFSMSRKRSLFHGYNIDLPVCASSTRIQLPQYVRHVRGLTRGNDACQFSYLVVRRGPRPTFAAKALQQSTNDAEAAQKWFDMRASAAKAKNGYLDILRKGDSIKPTEMMAEEHHPVGNDADENGEPARATLSSLMTGGEGTQAREDLLAILPDILKEVSDKDDGASPEQLDDAMTLAQQVMQNTARMTDDFEKLEETRKAQQQQQQQQREGELSSEDAAVAEEDSVRLASAFLAQQRAESDSAQQDNELKSRQLTAEDFENMRIDAYRWPLAVRTPLKRKGHIVIEACSAQGSIDRFIMTKSSGRQRYQDARKAGRGDAFPMIPREDEPSFVREALAATEEDVAAAANGEHKTDASTSADRQYLNIKTIEIRVPEALTSERNQLPTEAKIKSSLLRGKPQSKEARQHERWPKSSAMAIGANLVASAARDDGVGEMAEVDSANSKLSSVRQHLLADSEGRGRDRLMERQPSRARKAKRFSTPGELDEMWQQKVTDWQDVDIDELTNVIDDRNVSSQYW